MLCKNSEYTKRSGEGEYVVHLRSAVSLAEVVIVDKVLKGAFDHPVLEVSWVFHFGDSNCQVLNHTQMPGSPCDRITGLA